MTETATVTPQPEINETALALFEDSTRKRRQSPEKEQALTKMAAERGKTPLEMAELESGMGIPDAVLDFLTLVDDYPVEKKLELFKRAYQKQLERSLSMVERYRQDAQKDPRSLHAATLHSLAHYEADNANNYQKIVDTLEGKPANTLEVAKPEETSTTPEQAT